MAWRQEDELEAARMIPGKSESPGGHGTSLGGGHRDAEGGGAEGSLERKLTGPLEEGPEGFCAGGTSNRGAQHAGGGEGQGGSIPGLNTLKEALRRRSALVARAGVNHASFSQHVSFISPKTGFLSSARKDPGQSGTQNSQNLLSGLIRRVGDTSKKTAEQTRKQEAFQ